MKVSAAFVDYLQDLFGALGVGALSRRGRGRPDVIVDVGNGLPFLSPLYARVPVIELVHHVHREQWPVVMSPAMARFGWWVESWLAPRVYGYDPPGSTIYIY